MNDRNDCELAKDLKEARRRPWSAPVVLIAVGAVCVVGLTALWPEHDKDEGVVASATASVVEWRLGEVDKLLPVFTDAEAMKSGDYRVNDLSAKVFCPALVKDVIKAMADSRPAPDSQVQKHFASMLENYKAAGDRCVTGDMDGSWLALQAGEKEQEQVNPKK